MQKMMRKLAAPDCLDDLKYQFRRPPSVFRPVPQWWWNGDPTDKKTVRAQIMEMKSQGMGGVMPVAYYGLDLPYAGEAWYEMIRYVAEVCAEQKMQLWLYDEFHCASGTCAGRVLQEHPEYNCISLLHNVFHVRAGGTLKVDMRPSWIKHPELSRVGQEIFADGPLRLFASGGNICRAVVDYSITSRENGLGSGRPGITNSLCWRNKTRFDAILHVFSPAAAHSVMPSSYGTRWATHQTGYIDTLNPRAVKGFLERTFAGYDRLLSKYYGTVIPGVYTDEPGLMAGLHSKAGVAFPYTDGFFDRFRNTYGYDLVEHLVELASDIGTFRRTRVDYWQLVSREFNKHFNGQYARWCARRGLMYTGHFLSEESLLQATRAGGDVSVAVRSMHIPGIDLLGQTTVYDHPAPSAGGDMGAKARHVVSVKMAVSCAHAVGAPRVICETNGVPKWSVTLNEFKRMADWIGGMGVSFINDNGALFSVKGFRAMSGRSFSSPWWPYYRHYADYVARLSLCAAAGRSDAEIAVLYPVTAARAGMNIADPAAESASRLKITQVTLQAVSEGLLRAHCEYDFLFEDSLNTAAVHAGRLAVGKYRYRVVILAAVDVLSEDSYQALQRFMVAGGRVISVGSFPRFQVGLSGIQRLTAQDWRCAGGERVASVGRDSYRCALISKVKSLIPARLMLTPRGAPLENVQVARRILRDGQAVFLVNHADHDVEFALDKLPPGGEEWNIETGAVRPLCHNGREPFSVRLASRESRLLVFGGGKSVCMRKRRTVLPAERAVGLTDDWLFYPENDNILSLAPDIAFDIAGAGLAGGWQTGGRDAPWEVLKKDAARTVLSPDIMHAYWLRDDIRVDDLPKSLVLYHDGETHCRVFVNGREAKDIIPGRKLWDPSNLCFNLRPLIRRGRNRIVLRVPPSPYLADAIMRGQAKMFKGHYPQPVLLAGDFITVAPGRLGGWRLPCKLRSGSWVTQGFPCFAGRGRYRQTIRFELSPSRAWLDMPELRDVVEVAVNGVPCGIRAWAPYTVELTGALRSGVNRLDITLINTLGNVLRRHYFGYDTSVTPAGLLCGGRIRYVR